MTLAHTVQSATPSPPGDSDPVVLASALLHQAARLPFSTRRVRAWRSEFVEHVRAAADSLWRHASRADSPESSLATALTEPRLRKAVEMQSTEHSELISRVERLERNVDGAGDIDAIQAVEMMEEALDIEQALQRHYDHMVDLVYEATNREIGGRE